MTEATATQSNDKTESSHISEVFPFISHIINYGLKFICQASLSIVHVNILNAGSFENSKDYYCKVLKQIESSFCSSIFQDPKLEELFPSTLIYLHKTVRSTIQDESIEKQTIRTYISLDTLPFEHCRRSGYKLNELPTSDERRLAFQAMLLFILRPYIPIKYNDISELITMYPDFVTRDDTELEKLRSTANWMDLASYSISFKVRLQPLTTQSIFILKYLVLQDHVSLLMALIPQICEGKDAKYNINDSDSAGTRDRVLIFQTEGELFRKGKKSFSSFDSSHSYNYHKVYEFQLIYVQLINSHPHRSNQRNRRISMATTWG